MKWTLVTLVSVGLFAGVQMAEAQFGASVVVDPTNLVQNTITALNSVMTAANTAASYVRQGEQLINEWNMLYRQGEQITHMLTNLSRIPEGLNVFDTVNAYGSKLTSLMGQANAIGYELDGATRQFQELYAEAGSVATGDLSAVHQRFLAARMQASSVAVQMQSVQASASSIFQRLCDLLGGSWSQIKGNLDAQQVTHQQQALQLTTLQHMQALQATAYRLQAQREAEDVALQRLRQRVQEEFLKPLPAYTAEHGALPTWGWVTTTE